MVVVVVSVVVLVVVCLVVLLQFPNPKDDDDNHNDDHHMMFGLCARGCVCSLCVCVLNEAEPELIVVYTYKKRKSGGRTNTFHHRSKRVVTSLQRP